MRRKMVSLGAALGIAAAPGHALTLDPRGTGQVLVFPYYTVNGGNGTLLSVANATPHGKAVKVRFLEGYDGRAVASFNLYLSPYDVWVGQVYDTSGDGSGAAALATTDASCTVSAFTLLAPSADPHALRALTFSDTAYSGARGDGGPSGAARTREGFFEVIEMGEVTNASSQTHGSLNTITHIEGVPANCAKVVAAWAAGGYWSADSSVDMAPPSGGIYGAESILDVERGMVFAVEPETIAGFSSTVQHTPADAAAPDLDSADASPDGTFAASVTVNGRAVNLRFARPEDAVSALFMADSIAAEYLLDPAIGAQSEWVVTMPTKAWYVDPERIGATARAPFTVAFGMDANAPGASCSVVDPRIVDREEEQPVTFSTLPPPLQTLLCFQTGALTLTIPNSIIGSALVAQTLYGSSLMYTGQYLSGQILIDLTRGDRRLTSVDGVSLQGLPVTGFMVTTYTNANVVPGVLANYSAAYPQRRHVDCTTADGACE